MATLSLRINGTAREVETPDPDVPLLYVLRDQLDLRGTRCGGGLAQCGACTVLADGRAVRSRIAPARAVVGQEIVTIEGLGSPDRPDPVQALPNIPLLSLDAAGIAQTPGRSTGLIYQNVDPPYAIANVNAVVHWIPDAPLRTSAIRAPGKVANTFAVESFTDEIAALAGTDPVEFRARRLGGNARGLEVLERVAARMGWSPAPRRARATRRRMSSPAAASPSSTTSTRRRWWRWGWRSRSSARPGGSASRGWCAPRTAGSW